MKIPLLRLLINTSVIGYILKPLNQISPPSTTVHPVKFKIHCIFQPTTCSTSIFLFLIALLDSFVWNLINRFPISSLILDSTTLAYIWVVESLVWPKSFETVSMGTPLDNMTVVAKVCRATWKVMFLWTPHAPAISLR